MKFSFYFILAIPFLLGGCMLQEVRPPTPTTEVFGQVNQALSSQPFNKLLIFADPGLGSLDRISFEQGFINALKSRGVSIGLVASTDVIFSGDKNKLDVAQKAVRELVADGLLIILSKPIMAQEFHSDMTGNSVSTSDTFTDIIHGLLGDSAKGTSIGHSYFNGSTNGYSFESAIGIKGTVEIAEWHSGNIAWYSEASTNGNGASYEEMKGSFLSGIVNKLIDSGLVGSATPLPPKPYNPPSGFMLNK